jgi:hypothetical protein
MLQSLPPDEEEEEEEEEEEPFGETIRANSF